MARKVKISASALNGALVPAGHMIAGGPSVLFDAVALRLRTAQASGLLRTLLREISSPMPLLI